MSGLIECHIVATSLGRRRLAAVVPSEVQAWAADRAKALAPTTLRNLVGLLRSIYASAVLDRLVGRSPVVRVKLPAAHRERIVPLTVEQVRRLAESIWKEYPPAADGTIFTMRFGSPYRHDYYGSHLFRAAVVKAGLPTGTTTHDLRHHYASVLLMQGESVIVVAERLGHENASLVLSTYGHLMPDSEERTRRAVDDAWGCAPDVPLTEREDT